MSASVANFAKHFALGLVASAIIGLIALIALAVIDQMAQRVTDHQFTSLVERLENERAASTALQAAKTFRQQVFNVAAEIETMINSLGEKPSEDDEYQLTMDYGERGLAKRVRAIREKARNLTGYTDDTMALIKVFPLGSTNLRTIARRLEHLATTLPADVPADHSLDRKFDRSGSGGSDSL